MSVEPRTAATGHAAAEPTTRRRWSGVVAPALAALVCVAGTVLVWRLLVATRRGQLVEEASRQGSELARDQIASVTRGALEVISVPFLALVLVAAVAVALAQRRWSIAVAAVVLLAGSNLTIQVLQAGLVRPDLESSRLLLNSFPSGHAGVAASVAATALLIAPARWRAPVALLGTPISAGIGLATMVGTDVGAWHRASDVLGSVLITAAWYFALEAALAVAAGAPPPAPPAAGVRGSLRVLGVVGGLCAAPGLGALAATAVSVPTSDMNGVAYVGSSLVVIGAVCAVQASMLRLRPHHLPPRASL